VSSLQFTLIFIGGFKTSICSGKTPGGSFASVVGSPTEEFQSPNIEHPLNGHYYVEKSVHQGLVRGCFIGSGDRIKSPNAYPHLEVDYNQTNQLGFQG